MLADKDRIFTNLYGHHDWTLAGARERGAWAGTKEFIDERPRLDHQRGKGFGLAWPWRRRFPDRAQMDLHAQGQ